jgi:hypothetical protein
MDQWQAVTATLSWQTVTIILSIIGVIGAAILYQVSKFFQLAEAEKMVKGELLEAALNVALAVLLFVPILAFGNYFGVLYAQSVMEYHQMSFGDQAFQSEIDSCAHNIIGCSVSPSQIVAEILYSENVRGCMEKYMQSMIMFYSMFSGLYGIHGANLDITGAPTDAFVTTFQNLYLQSLNAYILLVFTVKVLAFMNAFGPVLIAVGIGLRAFAPTRTSGAFLIAMGIGAMLVFPIAYMMMLGNFYHDSDQLCKVSGELNDVAGIGSAEDSFGIALDNPVALPFNFIYTSARVAVFTVKYILGGVSGYFIDAISSTMITMCLTPFAAFAIMMTFIQITTSVLGGRLSEIGRGIFRLV